MATPKKVSDKDYSFMHVLFSRIPSSAQHSHSVTRRMTLAALIVLAVFDIVYCYLTYQHTSIIPFLGMLMVLLVYVMVDLATGSVNASAHAAAIALVPAFLAVLFSGTGGIMSLVWCILLPPCSMMVCGLLPGSIVSVIFLIVFYVVFNTPLGRYLPDIYPAEVSRIYPMVFLFVTALSGITFFRRFRTSLILYDSTVMLENAEEAAREQSLEIIRQTIHSIVNTVDARDNYTKEHSTRVAKYSALLAKQLGWNEKRTEELYQSALLHDIGKVGIRDDILRKNDALSDEEYAIVRQHTLIGEQILKDLSCLPRAALGAAGHHERYDGKGYPRGLKGDEIPLEARIIGIADAFDAMNSVRVYRGKLSADAIMRELVAGAGTQFDPELVKLFLPIAGQVLGVTSHR